MTTTINPLTDRAAWLAERRNGIGASEAAMVLGRSPYGDATSLALRKLGRLPDAEETEAMEIGTLMEPVIRRLYERRSGRQIVEEQTFRRHPTDTFLSATRDGLDDAGDLVEYKMTGLHSDAAKELGEEGSDDLPQHWLIQGHQQMHVFERPRVIFAVLVGGSTFRRFTVQRNQLLLDAMLIKLRAFWDQVQRGEVPENSKTEYSPRILAALNPECSGELVLHDASPITEKILRYDEISQGILELGTEREALKSEILQALGTSQFAALPDGRRVKRYLIPMAERVNTVKAHTQHYFKILKGG